MSQTIQKVARRRRRRTGRRRERERERERERAWRDLDGGALKQGRHILLIDADAVERDALQRRGARQKHSEQLLDIVLVLSHGRARARCGPCRVG
jgi:hypothetical protein